MASATTVHTATVSADQDGSRLDKWLAAVLPDLSRSRIKALIEDGRVTCAEATITDPSHRVKPAQTFAVAVPPAVDATPGPQAIELVVVFEDAHLIVIDKPAGMVVHPAPGNPDSTLVNALLAHCGDSLSGIGGVRRPGIVHRIDKDTSGLLVVAKSDAAHAGLAEQFAAHAVERAYWAVVWGVPAPRSGTVSGNIGRSVTDRKKMALVRRGGKEAVTHYKVLKTFGQSASLIECRLETGRTHQIRVHMTSLGHPLVGDRTYGRKRSAAAGAKAGAVLAGFPRQALHAYLLGFTHPLTKEHHLYQSSTPRDINELVSSLEAI